MLNWIETTLQGILDIYKASNDTTLEKVGVLDINALEKKFKDYLEKEQIIMTYRELPGTLPKMPIFDKIVNATMYVYAVENEKQTVKDIMDEFISTYNAVYNDTLSKILTFTNMTPLGNADNTGVVDYQVWQFGMIITNIDRLTSLHDRSVIISTTNNTFGSSTLLAWEDQDETLKETYVGAIEDLTADDYNIGFEIRVTDGSIPVTYDYYVVENTGAIGEFNITNGLVNYRYEKMSKYGEYPKATIQSGKVIQVITPRIVISVLDYTQSPVSDLKELIYDETYSYKLIVKSGSKRKTMDVYLINGLDTINENDYPILTFTFERS